MGALLTAADIGKTYEIRSPVTRRVTSRVYAIRGISFDVLPGESVGLVGESGSGKTTTGRCILRLESLSSGRIEFEGRRLADLGAREVRWYRRRVQAVFQDPTEALSPRLKALDIVREPLVVHREGTAREQVRAALELIERVGLDVADRSKRPADFSGGQRQRLAIARALVLGPSFLVLDEPTSALDVSVQAQILNLLRDLQHENGVAYLFISHNLGAVANVCDRVVVVYAGTIMESGPSDELLTDPIHPYTQALALSSDEAVTVNDEHPVLQGLSGEVMSARQPLVGCPFAGRCAYVTDVCRSEVPELTEIEPGRMVACHVARRGGVPRLRRPEPAGR